MVAFFASIASAACVLIMAQATARRANTVNLGRLNPIRLSNLSLHRPALIQFDLFLDHYRTAGQNLGMSG